MAIQFVGGTGAGRAGSTSTASQSLTSLTGGIASAPAEGDLVIVVVATASQGRNPSCAISGWNTIGTQLNVTTQTYDVSLQVSYKFMGSTPDTSVTIPSTGNIDDGQSRRVLVFRGVDPTTPFDVSPVSATGTGTTRFNAPAITPTTAGAWIAIFGGGSAAASTTALGTPSGISGWGAYNGADINDGSAGGGYYDGWTSGSYDPAAPTTGGSVNTANSWAAWTIALRPKAPNNYFTLIDSAVGENQASGTTIDITRTVPAGALLVGYLKWEGADGATVSIARSDTTEPWTAVGSVKDGGTANTTHGQFFYLLSATGGSATYRMTLSGARTYRNFYLWVIEFSEGEAVYASHSQATGQSNSVSSGDFSATGSDIVAFGGYSEYSADTRTNHQIDGVAADSVLNPTLNAGNSWFKRFTSDFTGPATLSLTGTPIWVACGVAFERSTGTSLTQSSTYTNSSTFYEQTVTPGAVTLTASLFNNSNSLAYTHVVSQEQNLVVTTSNNWFDLTTESANSWDWRELGHYSNVNTFYSHTVDQAASSQNLTASLYTNDPTFYAHTLAPGAVTLTASRYDNTASYYTHTLVPGAVTLSQTARFDNTPTFFAHTVAPQAVTLSQSTRHTNSPTFYTHSITVGPVTLTQTTRYDNAPAFYAHTATPGAVTLVASRYNNSESFYSHTVAIGPVTLTQTSTYANVPSYFSHTLTTGPVTLTASRYDNTSGYYTHSLTVGPVTLTQTTRFDNSGTFYAHVLTQEGGLQYLIPNLFENSPSFFAHTVSAGSVTLTQSSRYDNTTTFYSGTLVATYSLTQSARYTNSQGFYTHLLAPVQTLSPTILANDNTFFTHTVIAPPAQLTQSARLDNTNSFFTQLLEPYNTLTPSLFSNTGTYYTHAIYEEGGILPELFTNDQIFYPLSMLNQYPDPSMVRLGIVYGEPGLEFTGTNVFTLDGSPKLDIISGKMVKPLTNKVVISIT